MGLTINSFTVNNYGGLGSSLMGCCRPVPISPTSCFGCGFGGYSPFGMFSFNPFCSSNWMLSMLGFGLGWKIGDSLPAIGKGIGKFFKWVGRGFKSEKSKEQTEQAKVDEANSSKTKSQKA